jgi:hypothetical protein
MKNLIFILSFAFAMFFTNTTFAASIDNSSVNETAEIGLTEMDEVAAVSDAVANEHDILVIIFDDGTVIIVIRR